ncbi:pyridoxamine 5'-phosphate oxidase family protein [Marmoricola sp. RAF53]|uniref:pyridoxamine 5'-phosphate oxidase family protein n=1 Tax=Marmoricola sp. RAF53 TaxID=3233059 RepID=UPI003F9E50F7
MGVLVELSPSECRALLADRSVGRVAVVAPDGPHVVPVNFALVDEAVVFRTHPTTVLATYGRDAAVAFEVDELHDRSRTGWSVQVRGRTSVVVDSRLIAHIRRIWDPAPWADGTRNLYLRLEVAQLSGRQVGERPDPGEHGFGPGVQWSPAPGPNGPPW